MIYNQVEQLFQIGGNIAFIREPNQERYCQYLIAFFLNLVLFNKTTNKCQNISFCNNYSDTIPRIDCLLKCLNLSGIFFKTSLHEYLFKLDISIVNNSIVELDLSYRNLTDDEVSKLLLNQFLLKKS